MFIRPTVVSGPGKNKRWEIVLVSGSLQYRSNRNLSPLFWWGGLTHSSLFILCTLDSCVKLKTHCLTVVAVRMLSKLCYYVSENLRNFSCSKVRLFLPSWGPIAGIHQSWLWEKRCIWCLFHFPLYFNCSFSLGLWWERKEVEGRKVIIRNGWDFLLVWS